MFQLFGSWQDKSAKSRNPTNRQNKSASSAEFGRRFWGGGGCRVPSAPAEQEAPHLTQLILLSGSPAMPRAFTWRLPDTSHAVHQVLQEQALLHRERRASIHPRQFAYGLDESMRTPPHPHRGWENLGVVCGCAAHFPWVSKILSSTSWGMSDAMAQAIVSAQYTTWGPCTWKAASNCSRPAPPPQKKGMRPT